MNKKHQDVHGVGTAYRAISRKKAAALALCVSLWMAGGSVAFAADLYLGDGNRLYHYKEETLASNYANIDAVKASTGATAITPSGKALTITGGDWSGWNIYGRKASSSNVNLDGYHLTLSGVHNTETITGARTLKGSAMNNHVTLNGDNTIKGNVFGGDRKDGSDDVVTGNMLNLSGANTVGGTVKNFEAINITGATWGTPVLTLNGAGMAQNADGTWAAINTDGIAFSGVKAIAANGKTTLIQGGMGDYDGVISGTTYKLGTTLQGEGHAEKAGSDLIFIADTGVDATAREQTHNTVMGAEVGMAALSAGNDFVGTATEGLALASNVGADGVSSFAQMGGGSIRQETGSHVDVHTWNAILALGHQNKKERGTFEYGAFFEYGTGNYTTHAENDLRGDGSTRYTGGGLLAKYTMKNDVYVEGSLRAGSIHDDARDVMTDGAGNPYSYETNAPYWGAHIGVGKIIDLGSDHELDVYGKFYHNHRKGVSFNAGGHYDLDAVNSDVLRIGARYTLKREKWNFYGGLAYEHELDGKAGGTADGMKIRSADTSGASLRGELGVTFKPEKEGPLTLDFNVSGFAGKKRGVTGGVSVAWMF